MLMKSVEFHERREQLMEMMGEGSIAIIPAAEHQTRNRDVLYPYRQDSDFHYLTGFPEPEAVAVLIPGREQAEYILFCRESDEKKMLWDGRMAGQEGACETYGADDSFPIGDLDDILPGLLEHCQRVFYAMGCNLELDHKLPEWMNRIRRKSRTGIHGPVEVIALDHYMHEMRLFKSAAEISLMRRAAEVSASAHRAVMAAACPGLYEYQLEATFQHHCSNQGMRWQAYPSIVGSGANGCVLHYIDNDQRLRDGDLVLIDAGCENQNYASDITRTFPVSGVFSEPQKELYELVLEAQQQAIRAVKPGNHWNDPHDAAVRAITRGLKHLGLIGGGGLNKLIKDEAYAPFFPHRTGHWLGMDVHDVGDYKVDGDWRMLEAGMALTIEPGLYVQWNLPGVPKAYQNIGIRIEDDLVVTRKGHEILSADAPKTVHDIEQWMSANRRD